MKAPSGYRGRSPPSLPPLDSPHQTDSARQPPTIPSATPERSTSVPALTRGRQPGQCGLRSAGWLLGEQGGGGGRGFPSSGAWGPVCRPVTQTMRGITGMAELARRWDRLEGRNRLHRHGCPLQARGPSAAKPTASPGSASPHEVRPWRLIKKS